MKFVLYVLIIIAASAIARLMFGNRDSSEKGGVTGVQRLAIPDLNKIKAWLVERACEQCGEAVRSDPLANTRLSESAEKILVDIKESGKSEINLSYLTADQSGPKHFNISVNIEGLKKI